MSKKITFGIKDRLLIPQILPQEGSRTSQLAVRDLMEKVEFSQEEVMEAGIHSPFIGAQNGALRWGPLSPQEADYLENLGEDRTAFQDELLAKHKADELKVELNKEFEFSSLEVEELKSAARKLDDEKKITQMNLDTVSKLLDA